MPRAEARQPTGAPWPSGASGLSGVADPSDGVLDGFGVALSGRPTTATRTRGGADAAAGATDGTADGSADGTLDGSAEG